MPSLASCIKQANQFLTPEDQAYLQEQIDAGVDDGAILDVLSSRIQNDTDALATRIEDAGGQIQMDMPQVLNNAPDNVQPKNQQAVAAAREYARRSGTFYKPIDEYVLVDTERAGRIAEAYEAMEHNPNDPDVQAAYQALIDETLAQFEVVLETGLEIEFITGKDPYSKPSDVIDDVTQNNHMWVFPTESGFGAEGDQDVSDSPMLQETKYEINGHKLLANDVFRIVHDYFGHVKNGVGFRANGEENAWQSHAAMFSPLARKALTTETRGQNSWLNFGPHGEANRTAKTEETVFAPQKIGLLPDWTSEEGRISGPPSSAIRQPDTTGRDESGKLVSPPIKDGMMSVVHFSAKSDLDVIDPDHYGDNAAGVERERTVEKNWINRTYFGVEPGTDGGYKRETKVGNVRYDIEIPAHLMYDMVNDPDNLRENAKGVTNLEKAIYDAGYVGYWVQNPGMGMVGALFEPVSFSDGSNQSVLYQSAVALSDGRETLRKYGLKPGGKYNTRDVAAAMEQRTRDKSGKIGRNDRSPESMRKIARYMVQEVKFEMQHPEHSGVGWYSEKYARALEVMAQEFPELQTDQGARDTFTALVAITSDGAKVVANMKMARDIYANYRKTGKFTTDIGSQRIASVDNNLTILQGLIEERGVEGTSEYLMTEDTVSNLRKTDPSFKSDYPPDMKLPIAALVFGPKLGAFYGNLMGAHGYLTMDRWWSRSVNRYRGNLLTKPTAASITRFKKLINQPDFTEEQVLAAVVEPRDAYAARNFWTALERSTGKKQPKGKAGTKWREGKDPSMLKEHDIEKAANTIHKNAFENINDAPFNTSDRKFMFDAVKHAQKSLRKADIEMSVADIQAVLWYYEKRLYGEMGARQSPIISFEDAAMASQKGGEDTDTERDQGDFQVLNQSAMAERVDKRVLAERRVNKMFDGVIEKERRVAPRRKPMAVRTKVLKQPAFHGTPYVVDRFQTKFIGQGEGNQTFGWGLYFAAERQVGDFYRKSLSNNALIDGILDNLDETTSIAEVMELVETGAEHVFTEEQAYLIEQLNENDWLGFDRPGQALQAAFFHSADFPDMTPELENAINTVGNLYQVELKPKDEQYLRWDRPFAEQPQHIQNKLAAIMGLKPAYFEALGWDGGDVYEKLSRSLGGDKEASLKMLEMGIRGVKFLDQGSRSSGQGTFNYVIFDENDVQIVKQYEQYERGRIYLNEQQSIIQLGKASDLSTFLHEGGHLFLEMEKLYAKKYGISEDQKAILDWMGIESFDQITNDHHEMWAETFEQYLRTGKAPSLGLRRSFAAFSRWLKVIYRSLTESGTLDKANMTPEIVAVMDRMLATEQEIDEAAANPAYDQFFTSKEQSGMSDKQWADYQAAAANTKNDAEMKLDEKAVKQYMKTKTKEWEDEKAPLTERYFEAMGSEKRYQVVNDMKQFKDDDGVAYEGRMDTALLKEAIGGEISGRMIGKHVKEGGVDPALYAETHEYPSVKAMYDDIVNNPTQKQAAEDAAQEEMIANYGDILNDGTLEQEVREALTNDEQAKMLLMEINAMKKKNRKPGINRAYLKSQAQVMIGQMTYDEIQPDKYYRAMIKAAKDSVRMEDPTEAKIQELSNHYLYKESLRVKEIMTRNRRKIRGVQGRKYDTKKVDADYVQQIKVLANMYEMRQSPEQLLALDQILNFYTAQIRTSGGELTDLTLLDPNLVRAIEYRDENNGTLRGFQLTQFEQLTSEDLQGVVDMLQHLRYIGGSVAEMNGDEAIKDRMILTKSIKDNGGKDHKLTRGKQRPLEGERRTWNHIVNTMPSLGNMIRALDGFEAGGTAFEMIYQVVKEANDKKFALTKEFYDEMSELMGDVSRVGLSKGDAQEFNLEEGDTIELSSEEVFMIALYWGTESSREAIMQGHKISENDAMNIMSTLTEDQLKLVNVIWAMNETHWPELSKASIEMEGVAPPKLQAQEFVVNGVQMNGGHMQLYYDSQRIEMSEEAEQASRISSVMPTKAGTLNARVGSGGEPVLLDIANVSRSVDDKIHYISFASAGRKLRMQVMHKDVKAAIERKHGPGFYKAFVESIVGITSNRLGHETHSGFAKVMRWMRTSATMMHLAYSVRNTMQQFPALVISAKEVGPGRLAAASANLLSNKSEMVAMINEKSKFMENRATVINRDSREVMKELMTSSKYGHAWQKFKAHGFIMQTMADSVVAYPTWLAQYNKSMEQHGEEARARTEADNAVAESVGSGSDMHLGRVMQSSQSEGIKTLTVFGSWFNAYYQRLYKSSRGGTDFMSVAFAADAIILPFIVANLVELAIMNTPDDDETWAEYMIDNTWMFVAGTIPVMREIGALAKGFTPSAPINTLPQSLVRIPGELSALAEGRQSALKTVSDVGKAVTGVVKTPGSGQFWRVLDYIDSYIEGNEGDNFNPYQMLVEGANKDER